MQRPPRSMPRRLRTCHAAHTPSIAFRHLPPDSARTGCATEDDVQLHVGWHIRDKLWPVRKHGSVLLFVSFCCMHLYFMFIAVSYQIFFHWCSVMYPRWGFWNKLLDFTSTETVGVLGTGAQDGHLDFHTAPELWLDLHSQTSSTFCIVCKRQFWRPCLVHHVHQMFQS